jgi:hypothetical protein
LRSCRDPGTSPCHPVHSCVSWSSGPSEEPFCITFFHGSFSYPDNGGKLAVGCYKTWKAGSPNPYITKIAKHTVFTHNDTRHSENGLFFISVNVKNDDCYMQISFNYMTFKEALAIAQKISWIGIEGEFNK